MPPIEINVLTSLIGTVITIISCYVMLGARHKEDGKERAAMIESLKQTDKTIAKLESAFDRLPDQVRDIVKDNVAILSERMRNNDDRMTRFEKRLDNMEQEITGLRLMMAESKTSGRRDFRDGDSGGV